ncbi:Permease of the drug/metabolite transporter (DMT) superfamily [Flavobacterium gillisiae]|uniref:Permease of the drug/metabolite transporter (DMT) superfamily n=1 Tax=Flavobacterium gillisiae TaxID=150146 RepID=A0A1H3XSC1_9FLAO|nr:DMT family transporter [Flavobacterium gillisiae]SEA01811.1 Permease of the drug/metabolite transporter (DMT) superfamily [Flavobacterium gillisiae]
MNNQTKGILFALCATLLWSVNFVIASGIKGHIPPVGLAFWRWTIACVVLAPFAIKSTIRNRLEIKKNIRFLALTAVLGITIFNTLIYFAGKTTSAVNLSLIAISIPLFIVAISRIAFKEKVSNTKIIGILTIILGVLILITKGSLQSLLQIKFAIGDLIMLIACLFFASYTILVRLKPKELPSKVFLFSVFVLGVLFLFPFYLWEHLYYKKVIFDSTTIFAATYVGIFASLVSYYLWNEAITLIGTQKTALIYYLIPVFSGVLAYFFLNQNIVLSQIISMGIIIVGLFITNRKKTNSSYSLFKHKKSIIK